MNQQVVYPIIERNLSMRWWITPFDVPIPNLNSIEQVRFIRHGDIIRLEHKMTGKYLRPQKTPGINSQHQRIIASEQVCRGCKTAKLLNDTNQSFTSEEHSNSLKHFKLSKEYCGDVLSWYRAWL